MIDAASQAAVEQQPALRHVPHKQRGKIAAVILLGARKHREPDAPLTQNLPVPMIFVLMGGMLKTNPRKHVFRELAPAMKFLEHKGAHAALRTAGNRAPAVHVSEKSSVHSRASGNPERRPKP